jgi:acetyl esterase/lipase
MNCPNDTEKGSKIIKTSIKAIMLSLTLTAVCSLAWAENGNKGTALNAPQSGQPGQTGPMGRAVPKILEVPGNIQLDRDVVFTTINDHDLKLDIAYPKDNKGKLPAVVYIHGGGFEMGDKPTDQAVLFAKNGFIGITIEYRLSGEAKFPAAIHDCKTAIRWTRANAKKYGIDPDKIGVIGESAGGYFVAMMGTSGGDPYLEGDGPYREHSSNVQAVVDLFGPLDLALKGATGANVDPNKSSDPASKFLGKPVAEVPELVKKANPITYVNAGDAPTLMIHGEKDSMVLIRHSELFYDALTKAGVKARLVPVKNANHGFAASPDGATISPSLEEIETMEVQWFKDVFGIK